MKKTLLIGIVTLGASLATSFGQGYIVLDNYNTGGPNVTFGVGSGGTVGSGLDNNWTVGIYIADGTVAADAASGNGSISPLLSLGSGSGSTSVFASAATGGTLGQFLAANSFLASSLAAGSTVTVELVAYLTSAGSYDNSTIRGHSAAFTMTTSAFNAPSKNAVGSFMQGFSVTPVTPVPEPSTLALAGLGGFGMLMALRRKKA
jgi:hypothetical protein